MAYPVADLRVFLLGTWRISRRIQDARLGIAGRLEGEARFSLAPDGHSSDSLVYDEAGRLRFGAYDGEATQRYLFRIETPSTAVVHRADGSLFHRLELSSGTADIAHQCGEDRYRGRYRVLASDRLAVVWQVSGPHKRYQLASLHARIA